MWKKIGAGILFVAACFAAMYVLMGYYENELYVGISAAVLLITAFIFMDVVFLDKIKKLVPQEEEKEAMNGTEGDFQKKVLKHFQEMEATQKEMLEVLKNQNMLLQGQIDNLAHEIYLLSEKQVNQAKSIIKFNKENARQMAINERETLEYVMTELKEAIEQKAVRVVEVSPEEELPELSVEDMPEEFPDLESLMAEALLAEEPAAEEPATEVFAIEEPIEEEPAAEVFAVEEPVVEEVKAEEPLAGLSADPNAMMTPEDIAKLLEAMGQ